MTDQSLIALARQWAQAAFNAGQYVERGPESHIYNHFATEAENASIAFAAALAREQEAQPAALQHPAVRRVIDLSPGKLTTAQAIAEYNESFGAAQPAAQEPSRPKEIYATSANTESVRKGYEMGGYLKNRDELDAWDASHPPSAQEPSTERAEPATVEQSELDLFNDLNRTYGNTTTARARHLWALGYRKQRAEPQKPATCEGCNGQGMVGNILDTVECPFCHGSGEQGAEPQGLREDLLMLQNFVDSVIGEFPDIGDIDGFALQDIAEECGLLVTESKTVPCGDNCACTEVVDEGRTTDCMRVQPVLQRARRASALAALAARTPKEPTP
jgi:hypothetical protein